AAPGLPHPLGWEAPEPGGVDAEATDIVSLESFFGQLVEQRVVRELVTLDVLEPALVAVAADDRQDGAVSGLSDIEAAVRKAVIVGGDGTLICRVQKLCGDVLVEVVQ